MAKQFIALMSYIYLYLRPFSSQDDAFGLLLESVGLKLPLTVKRAVCVWTTGGYNEDSRYDAVLTPEELGFQCDLGIQY